MGYLDEYNKLKKKREEQMQKVTKSSSRSASTTTSTNSPYLNTYSQLMAEREAKISSDLQKLSTMTTTDTDIAPVGTVKEEKTFLDRLSNLGTAYAKGQYYLNGGAYQSPEQQKAMNDAFDKATVKSKKDDKKWFNSGLFKDGYQFGDVSKTILGTGADIAEDALTGIIGMGEKVVDAGAYIAPLIAQGQFYQNGGAYQSPEVQKTQNEMFSQAKKESAAFMEKDLYDENAIAKRLLSEVPGALQMSNINQAGGFATAQDWERNRQMQEEAQQYIDATMENESVLGEKSDALVQSAGQLAATMALQGLGVPWWLTTGATSFGAEAENALNQGATYEEAGLSAAITSGAEILTEKISGGIKFGGKTLDEGLTRQLSRVITDKTMRTLAKIGMDVAGEGGEEVLSGYLSAIGQKLTYADEKTMGELFSSEDALDAFIGGAILGGVSSAGQAVAETKKGNDYASGLTNNEKAVVDKVYQDAIAEQEVDGKKLSQSEKSKIYDETLKYLEKGYIDTDTIESVIGGETYNTYKSTVENEDALQKEYDELYHMKNGEKSDAQRDRQAELKKQLDELKTNSNRTQLKEQLDKEVMGLVEGSKLSESYNEKTRRKQKFEADLTQYDSKQAEVVKRAAESGILNNTNRTHDFVDMIAKVSAEKGVLFDFTNNQKLKESGFAIEGKTVNGFVKDGNISLNIDSAKALNSVVGHEITHVLEGTELYTELQTAIRKYALRKGEYDTRKQSIAKLYEGVEGANVDAEITAELVGDYLFTDADFINSLSTEHRNVFQKIYDEIKYLYKVATAGSKEARQLEKVKKAFEKAYRESGNAASDTKYSLSETSDGRLVAVVDNDILNNIDITTWDDATKKEAKKAAYNALKQFSEGIVVDGVTRKVNRTSRREYTRSKYTEWLSNNEQDVFADKMRAAEVADDIVVAATNWNRDGGLNHPRNDDFVDFDHGTTLIQSGESQYIAEVVVGITDKGEAVLYDVVDMQPTTFETKKESPTTATTQDAIGDIKGDSDNSLPQNSDKSRQYSLSDSDGKQLTQEQQNYFKDSKVRDENGSLKVMYHGTEKGGFHKFNPDYSNDGRSLFFTDSPTVAKAYSGTHDTYAAKTFKTAEDFNSFFKEISATEYEVVEENGKFTLFDDGEEVATTDTADALYEEFRDWSGVGYGSTNYQVYLNLKNPLIVDAKGENWDSLDMADYDYDQETVDVYEFYVEETGFDLERNLPKFKVEAETSERTYDEEMYEEDIYKHFGKSFAEDLVSRAKDDFEGYSIWKTRRINKDTTKNLPSKTRDFAEYAMERGYDGVIFKNIVDNGLYASNMERFATSTVAVAFDSNQVKSVENANPTRDPDIRYSLSDDAITLEDIKTKYKDKTEHLYLYEKNDTLSIDNLVVKKEYRNQGIGTQILKDVIAYADKNGKTITLTPTSEYGTKEKLKKWYKLHGFVENKGRNTNFLFRDTMYRLPRSNANIQSSLSAAGEQIAPVGSYNVYGKDIALEQDIGPVREDAPTTKVAEPFAEDYAPLTEVEANERDDAQIDRKYFLDQMAPEPEAPIYNEDVAPESPFDDRDFETIGNRKVKAYMYENPEVKPFFQEEAWNMLHELSNTQKGERGYNDDLYYETNGEMGFYGVKRHTSEDIAYLLDNKLDSYADIERGLRAIIEDHGEENNAASKRIEFLLDERLRSGYRDFFTGERIPPNQEYLNLLTEKQITEYNDEAWNNFLRGLSQEEIQQYFAEREDIAPPVRSDAVAPSVQTDSDIGPVREDIPLHEDASGQQSMFEVEDAETEPTLTRSVLHENIITNIKNTFSERGFDLDTVLKKAKDLSTFATVDNTPQRVMEKALGYKQGQVLSDLTVNQVAQNETEGTKWLNSFTDRQKGLLARISKQYHIKPGSRKSAAAQMYAEGFYVDEENNIIAYGDAELAKDFPKYSDRADIRGLARDPRIRKIYDDTLARINESRKRNAYPEIPRLDNYFLHFRAMEDTFSRLGLPFNPNDIRAKDLPTDLNGVTADLKPGQPYFASAMHRTGKRTSFDLLGGLERYLTSAKNQIYHIDDIQTLRALRNYIADTYGQAKGLESLDTLSEEEAQERIEEVYGSHLSTFAKFLNEEANVLAGKTTLIDRGLEGIIGRRGITFLDTLNKQVGANMVGYNVSSSLTNFLSVTQAFAKTQKRDFVKAFAQTVSNKAGSIFGRNDGFTEQSPVMIRRKGADRFYRTTWQKLSDPGYALMGAVDSISTELIARTKYNEFVRKGMDSQKAHFETDKWVSRMMGDRSLGQQPQLYNSKMLGLVTKFQLEVRNQLDAQFYDTIQETKASNEDIQNGLARNAKTAAKVTSVFVQLAVAQHLFGKAFESVAGYNPAFDIIAAILKAVGYDDEEESEDTVLDNIEQGFLELLGDMPYSSLFMDGGRIPISSALPIKQLVSGKDSYGNDKSRWETVVETAPYYVLPAGYGQIKKTYQGLSMFDDDLPIAGSYTDSGNLRFTVEDTLPNRIQAGVFGQWASGNARDYFDNERNPLKEKQIEELVDLDLPIADYWKYREGLAEQKTLEDKFDYIADLDVSVQQKNIMINNVVDRKEKVDMSNYDDFSGFEEFDFYAKNTDKYNFLQDNGVSYSEYISNEDAKKEYDNAYSWYKNNPEKVTVSKAITDNVIKYRQITSALNDIRADKDEDGDSISGSAKDKKIDYINSLDMDYGQKIILFRSLYDGKEDKETYNADIVDYLNSRDDISYEEMVTILEELDMTVYPDGTVEW